MRRCITEDLYIQTYNVGLSPPKKFESSLKMMNNAFYFILKNFFRFQNLLVSFSAICLSETWCESQDESQNSNYILSGYNFFYQYKQYRRGGGVCLFVKESFFSKTRQDLSTNCDAIESLCLEISNEKSKNIILNLTYKPPNGDVKEFEKHLNKKYYQQITF